MVTAKTTLLTSSRALKKSKTESVDITESSKSNTPPKPRLFQPFRAIGYVTNDVPFTLQARGSTFFLTTCVGRAFHIYDVGALKGFLSDTESFFDLLANSLKFSVQS